MDHHGFDQKWNRWAALSLMGGLVITIGGAVLVMILCPQPSWENQQTFVAAYHPLQSLIFVPSLALPLSIIAVLVGFHSSARPDAKPWTLLALVWGAVGATILCINYLIQGVFVPSLIKQSSGLVGALVSANPGSLFWTLELFGYGIVGLAMWGAAPLFSGPGIDRIIRWLLVVNGVGSILAGLGATVDSSWVLGPLGLGAVLVWNLLMIVLAALFLLRSRQEVG